MAKPGGAMAEQTSPYGIGVTVPLSYEDAVQRTRDALAAEGFGVLTEIDVRATLKQKLDVDFRPYVILGACNPPLAHRALTAERDIGLLLPCNVIVYAADAPGTSVVAALDPVEALQLARSDAVAPLAAEVRGRLVRALDAVAAGAAGAPAGAGHSAAG
jgi:uncharacterized protein (DUF302 family)